MSWKMLMGLFRGIPDTIPLSPASLLLLPLLMGVCGQTAHCQPRSLELAPIFADHMVLQRDKPERVWGYAPPGQMVSVYLDSSIRCCQAGADGAWLVELPAHTEGGPFSLQVRCSDHVLTVADVLIGDVYFCAGQSNMAFTAKANQDSARAPALHPERIRLANLVEPKVTWCSASDSVAQDFSAIGLGLAIAISNTAGPQLPVGIVQCAISGSPIQAWIKDADFPTDLVDNLSEFKPGFLFDKYLRQFIDFPVKSIVWYQGESDVLRFRTYPKLFSIFIRSCHEHMGEDVRCFVIQLPNLGKRVSNPEEGIIAYFRESQQKACFAPHCYLVPTIDLVSQNELAELHYPKKKPIIDHLCQQVLGMYYGGGAFLPPRFMGAEQIGSQLRLTFRNAGGGLVLRESKGFPFEIAGENGVFYAAKVRTEGECLYVWNKTIEEPKYVRYAWANNPECTLFGKNSMPVAPFRTDNVRLPDDRAALFASLRD
jgi:sialate O-acetylesterase